jgi:predicted Zn-dependent protease
MEQIRRGVETWMEACASPHEVVVMQLRGESSDFIRVNRSSIRQAGRVQRARFELRLIDPQRLASVVIHWTVPEGPGAWRTELDARLVQARELLIDASPDPYLDWTAQGWTSSVDLLQSHPDPRALADTLTQRIPQGELVGFCMSGPQFLGLWSSVGLALWHACSRCSIDASLYAGAPAPPDKAVKFQWSGSHWEPEQILQNLAMAQKRAQVLRQPEIRLAPGQVRAWLAPAATAELLGMLNWGGFSATALRSGQSPLIDLEQARVQLSPKVHLFEALELAAAPVFDAQGRKRAARIPLVENGRWVQGLVGPRSAKEFDLALNGAAAHETPEVLCMAPGELPSKLALQQLGTGLAISNLWYLNFSDRQRCRVTGMTRFATVWVQDGEPVAPVAPMRFDDSVLELLGSRLEAIEDTAHWHQDTESYDWRSFHGSQVPGLLVNAITLAL